MPDVLKPSPLADAASGAFVAGLAEKRLLIQTCESCGACQLGQRVCVRCASPAPAWVEAAGRGEIYSFAVIHLAYHPAFEAERPYVAGLVALAEGPYLYARIAGARPEDVAVGMAVSLAFEPAESGWLPVFRPEISSTD